MTAGVNGDLLRLQEEVGTNCDYRRKWGPAVTAKGSGDVL